MDDEIKSSVGVMMMLGLSAAGLFFSTWIYVTDKDNVTLLPVLVFCGLLIGSFILAVINFIIQSNNGN